MSVSSNNMLEFAYSLMVDVLAPIWLEFAFTAFFLLGFVFLRGRKDVAKKTKVKGTRKVDPQDEVHRAVENAFHGGNMPLVLKVWRSSEADLPSRTETLKLVVQAFTAAESKLLVEEIGNHMQRHKTLCNEKQFPQVLEVLAKSGHTDLMEELFEKLKADFPAVLEVRLGGHAAVGDVQKVNELMQSQTVSVRAYSLVIRGFLNKGLRQDALARVQEMSSREMPIPGFIVNHLCRAAVELGKVSELLNTFRAGGGDLTSDGVALLLDSCLRQCDFELAMAVWQRAIEESVQLTRISYDALLKMLASRADARAVELFREMRSSSSNISEGLCMALMSRCADAKFPDLAEEIVLYSRQKPEFRNITIYSAMMKVYAYAGMYDKACSVYYQIQADGLEPDAVMYGCLIKFATECGRNDLIQELMGKGANIDTGNYMNMIRCAGREKDSKQTMRLLEMIKESAGAVDLPAYNAALDACVNAGEIDVALRLVEEIRAQMALDAVSYNIIMKARCQQGNVEAAKQVLQDMRSEGLKADSITYNSLVSLLANLGDFHDAWKWIASMEADGVEVDSYTISAMMKALKKDDRHPDQVARVLALLDRKGIDMCSDEVLTTIVLETCLKYKHLARLEKIVGIYERASTRPSVITYGCLIKACSTLKRPESCQKLWDEMVVERGMVPSEVVLGCMLDALVCNDKVHEAVKLLRSMKATVPPNPIMYSILIKGFAASGQPAPAMRIFKELKAEGVPLNTVIYNALIDAQARAGAVDAVTELVASMGGDNVKVDAITYSTIVKAYCVSGDVDRAVEMFQSMKKMGLSIGPIIYNVLLDGCCRHDRFDVSDDLWKDMQSSNVSPSLITLSILVKTHGRRKQLDKAFEIFDSLPRRYELTVNGQARTALLSACLVCNNVQKALKVFQDLKNHEPLEVDGRTYGTLVGGLTRNGKLIEAAAFVEEAYKLPGTSGPGLPRGQHIEESLLENLVRALGKRGLHETVSRPLLERLRAAKVPIKNRVLTIAGCSDSQKSVAAASASWRQA